VPEVLLESLITIVVSILGAVIAALIEAAILRTARIPVWAFVLIGLLVGLLAGLLLVTPQVSAELCPKVEYISANPQTVPTGGTSSITVIVYNPSSSATVYTWSAERGSVPAGSVARQTVAYQAPGVAGPDTITVIARNSICAKSESISIQVVN
jgi:hypothetical protein